jgi:hypothetical protein
MQSMFSKFGMMIAAAVLVATGSVPAMAQNNNAGGGKAKSSLVDVLDFDGNWAVEVSTINSIPVVPQVCQTEPYLAGDNEFAVVNMGGYLVGYTGGIEQALLFRIVFSVDGGNFERVIGDDEFDSLGIVPNALVGNVSAFRKIPLAPGAMYTFGAEFSATNSVTTSFSRCEGTVTIVRLAP